MAPVELPGTILIGAGYISIHSTHTQCDAVPLTEDK